MDRVSTASSYRPIPAGTCYPPLRHRPPGRRKARGRGLRAIPWWGWLLMSPLLVLAVTLAAVLAVASGGVAVVIGAVIGIAICQPKVGRRRTGTRR